MNDCRSVRRLRLLLFLLSACLLAALSLPVVAQEDEEKEDLKAREFAAWIRANYTKYEYRIPMRDGKRLFTVVYAPKDQSERWPILLTRTPYSVRPYGVDNYSRKLFPSELFARAKYIFAYQDVRGRYLSEGEFLDVRPYLPQKKTPAEVDESSDAWDTIEFLLQNVSNHRGRVGMIGISYPGFYTSMGIIDAHPALKAASPQAPIADWFVGDDFHHNGALYLPHMFNFYIEFGQPRPEPTTQRVSKFEHGTPDAYNFFLGLGPLSQIQEKYFKGKVAFWNDFIAHPNYDAYWKARNVPQHLKTIKPAVLVVGGWFDAEDLYGTLHTYAGIEKNSPGATNMLVMGPWIHGGWNRTAGDRLGDVSFGAETARFYREQIELPFFEHHLKGKEDPGLPEAYVFETGSNQWRRYETWPPQNRARRMLYFATNGALLFAPPAETGAGFDDYVSDPAKPVPYTDQTAIGMTVEHMVADQRLQGRRTDVLVYQTEPLEEDITVAGPVQPSLFVSTTGTDSDFVVKLIDVYPPDAPDPEPNPAKVRMGEYQQLVRGEVMRGRYRESFEKPLPFEPRKLTKLEYAMPDVNHTFRRGHRIMVQVQSTWFPLVNINPQKFVDIYSAKPADFQKATQRVYHTRQAPSAVNLWVLERAPQPAAQPQ